MIKHQIFIAVALLLGVAIGYCVKDEPPPTVAAAKTEAPKRRAVIADADADLRIQNLQRRISELETALAAAQVQASAKPSAEKTQRPNGMANHMAQFRRSRQERMQAKQDYFASIDTSRLSKSTRSSLSSLQGAIDRRAELDEQNFENMTEEQRREAFHKMREADQEIRQLNGEVRKGLLEETVKLAGLEGEDATAFVEEIQAVVDATEDSRGFGGPRRGGMPPPPSN